MYVILRGDLLKLSTGLCSWLVGRYGFPIPPSPPQSLSRSLALSLSLRELAHSLSLSLSLTHNPPAGVQIVFALTTVTGRRPGTPMVEVPVSLETGISEIPRVSPVLE